MKVYIVTKEPFPNGMAATNRIKCYSRAIADGGIDCEVLIIGGTEIRGEVVRNEKASGYYENVHYKYIGGTPILPSNKPLRLLSQLIRLLKTLIHLQCKLKKGDVVFLYDAGKLKQMIRFTKVAKRKKSYCVLDLCEYPYVTAGNPEVAIQLRKVVNEQLLPQFDGIISISDALLNYAKQFSSPSCMHLKVPIMVEYEKFRNTSKNTIQSIPYIFHAGTLYQQKDGILGLIEAFGIARQKLKQPIKYILTGSIETSSHPQELKSLILKYDLEDSLTFVGYLNRDQINKYLSNASLVISNRPKTEQDYYGFSTKLGEYLASGTPLIITNWGEAVNWLKDGVSAYIIEPENTNALADAIVRVFNNSEEAHRIGMNGQNICRDCFDYHKWSATLVDFLKKLT